VAPQHHSWTSREIQLSVETSSHHPQLVRNLANILGGIQEEVQLAFEAELELDGRGALFRMVDA